MEILKLAQDWARSEVFSTRFFILFALVFLAASFGFWHLGKTEIARAYVIPLLVAGALLLTIGLGLFFTNKNRISQFEKAYHQDTEAFISSEITRAENTLKEYQTIVFTAIPIIIAICALVVAFVSSPIWRASMITTIAMLVVILLIDGTAHARINDYYQQLISLDKTFPQKP
ncbi:hypothetical protein [Marinoscillum furvescens]|uniref:Uncharacterized protein n=1 Tax=Marinoscillum furvescens DSM 4134 TaxID=1122208 RepID=A0A3D9KXT4_MARFU|nr:hypothetical protein [Marinoscillum furvescens]RED93886.1 hypothetical protein C7460_12366 [Marinoscillum furvescens DSM 4134]